jgi:hypothetical protein
MPNARAAQELPSQNQSLTLKMTTTRFAETTEKPQHSIQPSPKSQKHILN